MGKTRNITDEQPEHARVLHDRITGALRDEIRRQGLTYYRIAKDTGISSAALSRFRQPGGTLKTQSLFVLLDYLGVDLVCRDGEGTKVFKARRARR
jgi:hypothetical protein